MENPLKKAYEERAEAKKAEATVNPLAEMKEASENLYLKKPSVEFDLPEGTIIAEPIGGDLVGAIDFFQDTEDDIDAFEERAWKKGSGFKAPKHPMIEEYLEGIGMGFYLFAGESNMGKTAAMTSLLYDIGTCEENNCLALLITIDDTKDEVIPRIVAQDMHIPISAVGKPQRYQDEIEAGHPDSILYEEYLEKRKEGLDKLKANKDRFKVVDALKEQTKNLRYSEGIEAYIEKLMLYLKTVDPERKLIVGIDSLNDVSHLEKNYDPKERNEKTAKWAKGLAKKFDMPVFGTTHLRKVNGNRRPTTDDLKDTVEYHYESSVMFLVYNDVSKNKEAANVSYNNANREGLSPVIELDWAKNKNSSYKGRTYYYFVPEESRLSEAKQDAKRSFDAIVYEQ